jgi:putative membrane protein insertion efficiency factor
MSSIGEGHLEPAAWLRAAPLLPRNAVLVLLHGYRATISHVYGDVCKYYPSCSAYAVGAVQQHGALKGAALAAARLARCHPWAQGGIDDVPPHRAFRYDLTPHGFVVPPGKD